MNRLLTKDSLGTALMQFKDMDGQTDRSTSLAPFEAKIEIEISPRNKTFFFYFLSDLRTVMPWTLVLM